MRKKRPLFVLRVGFAAGLVKRTGVGSSPGGWRPARYRHDVSVPDLIPIAHEPEYRTDTIGRYSGGQFYAQIHGARRDDDQDLDLQCERVRWYVYLHLFDAEGRHVKSDISLLGVAPYFRGQLREQGEAHLAHLLDQLPERRLADIAVQPFRVLYDGVTFGLIDESDAERGDWVELYPDRLGFTHPWDGDYST
jgi:hypothetical protein